MNSYDRKIVINKFFEFIFFLELWYQLVFSIDGDRNIMKIINKVNRLCYKEVNKFIIHRKLCS